MRIGARGDGPDPLDTPEIPRKMGLGNVTVVSEGRSKGQASPPMSAPTTAPFSTLHVVDDDRFDAHRSRGAHPERPERLAAARAGLAGALPDARRVAVAVEDASDEALERVHGAGYVRRLRSALGEWGHLDADTYFCPESEAAAWGAAGGAAALTRRLLAGEPDERAAGIALLRPPGHHARPGAAMGFCLLNNVDVAADEALALGAERVAIVDWDVHHGNGTQEIFWEDPRVLFVSLHQYPHYPGTGAPSEIGAGAGRGKTINLALPAGSGPEVYGEAFRRVVLPALDEFGADLTLVSAGFDAHARDPLAGQELDDASYGAFAGAVAGRAARLGLMLEGGYDLQALEGSVRAVGEALLETGPELPEGTIPTAAEEAIERTRRAHAGLWRFADEG